MQASITEYWPVVIDLHVAIEEGHHLTLGNSPALETGSYQTFALSVAKNPDETLWKMPSNVFF